MLTLVYMEEARALCLKQRVCLAVCKFGRYPSTRSFPLPLISPGPSEVAVLRHSDSDQYSFQTLVWLRRPSQVPSLSSGLVWLSDWSEQGPQIIRGKYKDMGRWWDNTPSSPPPFTPLFHLPFTFPSVLLSVLPPICVHRACPSQSRKLEVTCDTHSPVMCWQAGTRIGDSVFFFARLA